MPYRMGRSEKEVTERDGSRRLRALDGGENRRSVFAGGARRRRNDDGVIA